MSKITVTVSGETGSGKSAIAGEIEIALKAIGVPTFVQERDTMVHADYMHWIELYKPEVTIYEQNIPRPAHQPELAMQHRPAAQRISQQAGILAAKNSELQNLRSLLADRNEEVRRLNLLLNEPKEFHGAECHSYPNCTGGCGLGCTYEIVNRPPPHLRVTRCPGGCEMSDEERKLEWGPMSRFTTGELFNELLRRIDFDGMNPRTFSLAELHGAIKGAEWPSPEPAGPLSKGADFRSWWERGLSRS